MELEGGVKGADKPSLTRQLGNEAGRSVHGAGALGSQYLDGAAKQSKESQLRERYRASRELAVEAGAGNVLEASRAPLRMLNGQWKAKRAPRAGGLLMYMCRILRRE